MERSTSSLTYEGSISNAIIEARSQKKLFVVYISGEDENSIRLEQSTWVDLSVAESISRYCIFLHLVQGSVDASQFTAIYPQKSIPSISAVGYNGVMLWQHEGYITAENFVESIEKAWGALHLQDAAATLLTAALASKKPEPSSSSSPSVPFEQGSSSRSYVPSTSTDKPSQVSVAGSLSNSDLLVEQKDNEPRADKDTELGEESFSQLDHVNDSKISRDEQSGSWSETCKEVLNSVTRDDGATTCSDGPTTSLQENLKLDDSHTMTTPESAGKVITCGSGISQGSPQIIAHEVEEITQVQKVEGLTDGSNAIKSNDIHLNIRLPNGASLQAKFSVSDTLGLVKNYVDENQIGGMGSYNLAVPYPRKVFNEQEMGKALSELGFASRQALIVVPHRQAATLQRGQSSSNESPNTVRETEPIDSGGGYFGYMKRIFSYMNPLSYLGGNANSSGSETAPSDRFWQYRAETSSRPYPPNHQSPPVSDRVNQVKRAATSRPFGSNIHTLRHDEDEAPSRDRNTFWNGNSTEFGGDDKK